MPAKAGIQPRIRRWTPAFAGVTDPRQALAGLRAAARARVKGTPSRRHGGGHQDGWGLMPNLRTAAALVAVFIGAAPAVHATDDRDPDAYAHPGRLSPTEIDRQVTDPVSVTWSVKLENDLVLRDLDGPGAELEAILRLQSTMPVLLGDYLKLIARPRFTLVDDKPYTGSNGALERTTGFGDTILDLVLSPRPTPWRLALGPTFVFPTANLDQTGQGKWQIGPAGVAGYRTDRWLAGFILQQWFSYAGDPARKAVSEMHLQYLASWFFDNGWSVGTQPTMKVQWNAAPGQQVTFPFGPTIGKVVKFGGSVPVKFEIDLLYTPVHPSNGEEASFQIKVIPVVPSPLPPLM
ncbi:hypothetical protein L6Q96_22545 [Candidatus Binatia bacterium]|nr:hypothetical protein [Candidatus Binatia bacterium]